jgi:cytochrome P450
MATIPDVNIAAADFKSDPYPYFARLRAEAPVHRVTWSGRQAAWLIARDPDVVAARARAPRPGVVAGGDHEALNAGWGPPGTKAALLASPGRSSRKIFENCTFFR